MEKVKMNKEDREKFATGMKTASPMELLSLIHISEPTRPY